jgi:hypothetical protein
MYERVSRRGLELDIGFIDHYNTITFNYSAIADFHTLPITSTHAKSFPALSVFTSSCLVTAPTMVILLLPWSCPL